MANKNNLKASNMLNNTRNENKLKIILVTLMKTNRNLINNRKVVSNTKRCNVSYSSNKIIEHPNLTYAFSKLFIA